MPSFPRQKIRNENFPCLKNTGRGNFPYYSMYKNFPGINSGEEPRKCRAGSIITCTKRQVGRLSSVSLLPTSKAFRRRSGRPAIRRLNSASLIRDVGLMSHKGQSRPPRTQQELFFYFSGCCYKHMPPLPGLYRNKEPLPGVIFIGNFILPLPHPHRQRGWS